MPAALPLIVLGVSLTYLALLIFYYVRSRKGRIPLGATSIVLIVAVAVLGVLPTEVLSIIWIGVLQSHVEVTANLFILVPAPIIAAMAAIQALLLARIYSRRPLLLSAVYLGVFAAVYAFWLSRLFNPPSDILRYVLAVLVAGSVSFGLVWRFSWRRLS